MGGWVRGGFLPVSRWSAAKCTDRSNGNAQSVHLFEPAGHRYLSQWGLHPQTPPSNTHLHRVGGRGVGDFQLLIRSENDELKEQQTSDGFHPIAETGSAPNGAVSSKIHFANVI